MDHFLNRIAIPYLSRPLKAIVHSDALRHNYQTIRRAAKVPVWAALKANAYGHGLIHVAQSIAQEADGFAVLELEEALALRGVGLLHPILILEGAFRLEDWVFAHQHDLIMVVHHEAQIDWLEQLLSQSKITAPSQVYFKVNTGMNRLGFAPGQAIKAYERLRSLVPMPQTKITLMTHYARADDGLAAATGQNNIFEALCAQIKPDAISRANSAAILQDIATQDSWMRTGIALYGSTPVDAIPAQQFNLKPAMSLMSELISIQTLEKGDAVGYGARFVAEQTMKIGVVACGYADGYPRTAPLGTPIMVDGIKTRLVGRVSMDMLTVDLSNVPQAKIGSSVEFWGNSLSVDEVAAHCGTNGYEMLASLTNRVSVHKD
jgi:alanine racemase